MVSADSVTTHAETFGSVLLDEGFVFAPGERGRPRRIFEEFGAVSALASVRRDEGDNHCAPVAIDIGLIAFFGMPTWYLYARLPAVFWLGVIIAALVFTVETVYFERESIEEGIQEIERQV